MTKDNSRDTYGVGQFTLALPLLSGNSSVPLPLSSPSFHLSPSPLIHSLIRPINIYWVSSAISSTPVILMTTCMLMSLICLMNLKSLILAKISPLRFRRTRLSGGYFVFKSGKTLQTQQIQHGRLVFHRCFSSRFLLLRGGNLMPLTQARNLESFDHQSPLVSDQALTIMLP